jgi:Fe-S-cluster containining protein
VSEATPSGATEPPFDPAPAEKGKQFAVLGVELNTPDGPMRGKVQVDTGPMRLSELVQTAYELTGVVTSRANKKQETLGKSISCRAGCAACCRQMVPLSPPEAFYLMDMIDSLDSIKRAWLLGRFESIVAQLEAENMIQGMLDIVIGADESRTLNKKYFAMQLACPFLVDESCSIHADRPVACREYNVTSPALWCSDPFGNGVEKVPMPIPLSAPLAWLTAELVGGPPALIPLTLMPQWVAEHEELRQRTWPGLELFKKFMAVAAGEGRKDPPEPA